MLKSNGFLRKSPKPIKDSPGLGGVSYFYEAFDGLFFQLDGLDIDLILFFLLGHDATMLSSYGMS